MTHAFSREQFQHFARRLQLLSGQHLEQYKDAEQRLEHYLQRHGGTSLEGLLQRLEQDPAQLQAFWDAQTINVSSFFRNPARFQELKQKILPMLLAQRSQLRVWSAGCAMGAEAYSLVILLANLQRLPRSPLLASDVDTQALDQGRSALYTTPDLEQVPRSDLSYYFEPELEQDRPRYRVKSPWREAVRFRYHDLLGSEYPQGFDLIVCRNVMIYFNKETKYQVYRKFHQSLKENGVLFVGGAEQLLDIQCLGYRVLSPYFLQKHTN